MPEHPSPDELMRDAMHGMARHRAAAFAVNRRGWSRQQWVDDAIALMGDPDGSVSSLVNGHVSALIGELLDARKQLDQVRAYAKALQAPHESREANEVARALLQISLSDEAGKNQEATTPMTPEASGRGTGAGLRSPVEWPGRQPTPPGALGDFECCSSGSCEVCW